MKKSHIFALLLIAAAIVIIISTAGDASTYVTFKEAKQMSDEGSSKKIHVVGEMKKDDGGKIIGIVNGSDKVSFSFVMVDMDQREQRVEYHEPMPPDMMKSEKIVVVGRYEHNEFLAQQILLKCPSKYVEKNLTAGVTP